MSLYSDLNEVLTPYAQRIKGLAAANDTVKADLVDAYSSGSTPFVDMLDDTDTTYSGISYSLSGNTLSCDGTSTSASQFVWFGTTSSKPPYWFVGGGKYIVSIDSTTESVEVRFQIKRTSNTSLHSLAIYSQSGKYILDVPEDITVLRVVSIVNSGITLNNDTLTLDIERVIDVDSDMSELRSGLGVLGIKNELTWNDGSYKTDGTISTNVQYGNRYSNIIDATTFNKLTITPFLGRQVCVAFFDRITGAFVSRSDYTTESVTIDNTYSVGINLATTYTDRTISTEDLLSLVEIYRSIPLSKWTGRKVAFVGDSITHGSYAPIPYHAVLNNMIGFSDMYVDGVAGSAYSVTATGNYTPISQRWQNIPTDRDLVVIFAGTNDWGHDAPIGTPADTTDVSMCGALSVVINGILTANPSARLVLITPLHRWGYISGNYPNDTDNNGQGHPLADYVDAIKDMAQTYSIPVIDLFSDSGLNPRIPAISTAFFQDGLHPINAGHARLARQIASELEVLNFSGSGIKANLEAKYSQLSADLNELLIPLELVATYDNKILRKTGMADYTDYTVYLYKIPDNCEKVHIKTNFYGNVFIIFTDMAENGDFSSNPYQSYPTSSYPSSTTVDDDFDTKGFGYVWIPLYKRSGITASAKYSAFELVDNNKQGVDDLNAKVTENKRDIVALQADVDELKGLMKYPGSFNMEIGNISLYGYNDLRGTSSTSRVRTLQGGNIHMKQGYKVTLSDYTTHRYFLFQIVSSERVNALGWKQEDFVVTDEADYAIIISALPEATVTDIAELASLMTIYTTKDEEDESGIPSYWDNEITASISTIQSNELSAGNRIFEFLFLTDTHWSHNAKNSPAIVEFLSDKFHINQIFGGDVITSHYENKSQAIAEVRAFYEAFAKPLPTVLGNHDFNAANDTTQRLSMAECYALMIRQQENIIGMDTFASPYYWTLDNVSQKVRVIGFRCDGINAVSSDITNKVKELISTLSAEWNVILLTHGFWAVTSAGDPISIATPVQAVIDAIMPTIESANASVPLWVVGHSHRDQSQIITGTSKSILVLGCNCDAYSESAVWGGETMTQGTATEQAITCIQLDMLNNKIHAVRIGAGNDRTFTY